MKVQFEKLVSRSIVNLIRDELELAGLKVSVEEMLRVAIIGGFALFIIIPFTLKFALGFPVFCWLPSQG